MAGENTASREKLILDRILTLKQMLREDGEDPISLHELGICYSLLGNFERAAEYLARLLEQTPDYLEGGAATGLRAYCLIQVARYEEAEALLRARIPGSPTDARLLAMLAFVFEKTGRTQEAIETHRRILSIDPGNTNSLNSLGYLLTLHGSATEAGEAYDSLKKALEASPNNPAYLDSFGVFLARRGQTDNARRALTKALQRAPQNAEILGHLKQLLDL